jgi:hypothetical protein
MLRVRGAVELWLQVREEPPDLLRESLGTGSDEKERRTHREHSNLTDFHLITFVSSILFLIHPTNILTSVKTE